MLAHIRYRCATDGPGRFAVEGVRWWRVSLTDLAAELNMSRDAVNRTLKRLGDAVAAKQLQPFGDRTRAYHVAPFRDRLTGHIADSQQPDQPYCGSATGVSRNRNGVVAESPHVPISGEVEEGGRSGRADMAPPADAAGAATANSEPATPDPFDYDDDPLQENQSDEEPEPAAATAAPTVPAAAAVESGPDPKPQRYCDEHMPDGTPDDCPPCGHYRRRHRAWEQDHAARNRAIRRAIDDCDDCDASGRLNTDWGIDCPKHENFRKARVS